MTNKEKKFEKDINVPSKEQIKEQGCHKCVYSKMNGMELICTEWQEVIEDDECLCSCYKEVCNE